MNAQSDTPASETTAIDISEQPGPFGIQMRNGRSLDEPTYGPFVIDPETGRTAVFQTEHEAEQTMFRWFRSDLWFRVAKIDCRR